MIHAKRCTCHLPEQWRPTHIDGYEVSNHGRVRSLPREIVDSRGQVRRLAGCVLRPGGHRYPSVALGFTIRTQTHYLVAAAFLGDPPAGRPWVLHYDDDPRHCCDGNLRYGTARDNAADRERNRRERLAKVAA